VRPRRTGRHEPADRQPHHLEVLREAGLVTSEERGTDVWYAALLGALEGLREALAGAR
jgi:ArsR family transcriptional regulator